MSQSVNTGIRYCNLPGAIRYCNLPEAIRGLNGLLPLLLIILLFFLISTSLCEFWVAQLFLSMVSFPVPSVSNYLLPSSSNHLSRHHPILILAFLSVLLRVVSIYKCF